MHRTLGLLLAVAFALFLLAPAQMFAQTAVCGDQNGDGALSTDDLFWLVNYLFAGGPGPANCPTPTPVPKTGQTLCYDAAGTVIACAGTGQDGDKRKGVAWPNPRFTDNGNGTVKDNLTGLIWLKNANCFGAQTWATALTSANTLKSGACGLTDGSVAGDWRLPNRSEQESVLDLAYPNPALSNAGGTGQWTEGDAFSDVRSYGYWSSSTGVLNPVAAWYVGLDLGESGAGGKDGALYVWPVRGGQ